MVALTLAIPSIFETTDGPMSQKIYNSAGTCNKIVHDYAYMPCGFYFCNFITSHY